MANSTSVETEGGAVARPNAVGRSVKVVRPPLKWNEGVAPYRSDGWIDWRLTGGSAPSVRVWATQASTTLACSLLPSGMQFFTVHNQAPSRLQRRGLEPPDGQFLLGTWFAGGEALDRIDFAEQVVAIRR